MKDLEDKGNGHIFDKLTVNVLKDLIRDIFNLDEYKNKEHHKHQPRTTTKGLYKEYVSHHGLFFGAKGNMNDDQEVPEVLLHDCESSVKSSNDKEIDANNVEMV